MPGLLSNFLTTHRSKKVINYLKGDLLDVGCGDAKNYRLILQHQLPVTSYTGIEFDPEIVIQLGNRYPRANFYRVDLDSEPLPVSGKYDTILLLAVVEHIFNLKFLFSQLARLLSKKGQIVITTPTHFGNDIVHRAGTKLGLFDREGGQEDHIVIFNRKRLEILAGEVDLVLQEYKRFQVGCNQIAVFKHC